MPPKYAVKTTVPVDKTKIEIEELLRKYGADQFQVASDWATGEVVMRFRAEHLYVQYAIQIEDRALFKSNAAHQQHERSMWRALLLIIKAKLEAIASGISEFEEEFLAHIVTPEGKTVGQWLRPQLAVAYETGVMPKQLLALPAPSKGGAT